MSSKRLIKTIR